MLREVVELLGRDDVLPEIGVARGARDLRRMQGDVGRAADRHGDDHGVADRISHHDVARLEVVLDHFGEVAHQLVGEFIYAARIVGRRRHHVQRLHADHADEGLHGVVGEHAAAAADAGAGVERDVLAERRVGIARDLVGGDEVDRFARLGVVARVDRAVRHDDGGPVVLEECGQRADRRLVAGHDRDGAGEA